MNLRASLAVIAALIGFAACDDDRQCQTLSAFRADEARSCLVPPVTIPDVEACTAGQVTRGVLVVCLVDDRGQLYLATTNDSAELSGTGWHYTGGAGDQQLSAPESQRCAAFSSSVGYPEPAKQCEP